MGTKLVSDGASSLEVKGLWALERRHLQASTPGTQTPEKLLLRLDVDIKFGQYSSKYSSQTATRALVGGIAIPVP